MLRRNVRLRKEFLYRKNLEGKEKEVYEKKRKLKDAMDNGTEVPTELRPEAKKLMRDMKIEGDIQAPDRDDEYTNAGVTDPKVFVTTSRDPSSKLIQFSKEVRDMIPNAAKLNRGSHSEAELMDACKANEVTDLIILSETRGVPDGMVVCHLPYGPTAYFGIMNCVMRHDIPDVDPSNPSQYPHLILDNFTTDLGKRISNILKYLFPVPKEDSHRVATFANNDDFVSFRHHFYKKEGKAIELRELGPRFELKAGDNSIV
eukprot:TRINITY_DN1014_c0_g1_i2.p1 TRINITY_DN1014_c0_g1~~TRINITY_DN1014_c0_g1_i2.p1  ORF type:complete len:259 (-),score=65.14 TRINITY_DN1014_c0_g1_i2:106-882(-)